MEVKDRVVTWWIHNIIIPNQEIIDKPGFVVTTFTEKKFTTYLREFFLPEKLFETIENKIIEKHGDSGRKALYSAGKKFGYIYASMSNFTTISNTSKDDISKFAYLLVRYIEGTYAKEANHKADVEHKEFTIFFDNYIICRNNGNGHIMTEGGITGIWSYGMQDKTIEGVQLKCQGRGDNKCMIICGPENKMQEKTKSYFCERDLIELKSDINYKSINEIRETKYSKNSLKDLLNANFFKFKKGILSYKDHRFFHCESHILYLLEQEISKLDDGEKNLFNACFEYGKHLAKIYGKTDYQRFIPDFFSALGFGDILISHEDQLCIHFIYYPWTIFSKQSNFLILRGIMSGLVSYLLDKRIIFNNSNISINNYLTVTIKE